MRFDATDYGKLTEGQHFASVEFSITHAMWKSFQSCFYFVRKGFQQPVDTPAVKCLNPVLVANFAVMKAALIWPTGVLHAREQIRLHHEVKCEERLIVDMKVKQKLIRNERKFVVLAIQVRKSDSGALALEAERTLVWPN